VFKQSLLWAAGVYEFKCHEGNFIMNENVKTPSLSQLRYQARKLKYKLGSRKGGASIYGFDDNVKAWIEHPSCWGMPPYSLSLACVAAILNEET
jgi:hypothetical protein